MAAEIYRIPGWHWVVYANGLYAQVVGGLDKVLHDPNGEEVLEFEIKPGDELIIAHNIKPEEYTKAGTLIRRYYKVYHKILCMNPAFTVHGLLCDYNGKDGPWTDYFFDLVNDNRSLKKMLVDMRAHVASLNDRIQQLENQTWMHDKLTLRRYNDIKKFVRGPVIQTSGGEEYEIPTDEDQGGT